jgi:hypothetical protein
MLKLCSGKREEKFKTFLYPCQVMHVEDSDFWMIRMGTWQTLCRENAILKKIIGGTVRKSRYYLPMDTIFLR